MVQDLGWELRNVTAAVEVQVGESGVFVWQYFRLLAVNVRLRQVSQTLRFSLENVQVQFDMFFFYWDNYLRV